MIDDLAAGILWPFRWAVASVVTLLLAFFGLSAFGVNVWSLLVSAINKPPPPAATKPLEPPRDPWEGKVFPAKPRGSGADGRWISDPR